MFQNVTLKLTKPLMIVALSIPLLIAPGDGRGGDGTMPFSKIQAAKMVRPLSMPLLPDLEVNLDVVVIREGFALGTCDHLRRNETPASQGTIWYDNNAFELSTICADGSMGEIVAHGTEGDDLILTGSLLRRGDEIFLRGTLKHGNAAPRPFILELEGAQDID